MSAIFTIPVIIFIAITVVLFLFLLVSKQNKKIALIEQQQNELSLLCDNMQHSMQTTVKLINKEKEQESFNKLTEQVNQQQSTMTTNMATTEQQIKSITTRLTALVNNVDILANQQPEDKLYSRALKLAALGAGIEEISQNCEIPMAEAEMLLAVHQTKLRDT